MTTCQVSTCPDIGTTIISLVSQPVVDHEARTVEIEDLAQVWVVGSPPGAAARTMVCKDHADTVTREQNWILRQHPSSPNVRLEKVI